MQHVLWIGGAPASGKTTIATTLARRHGLRLYSADTRTWIHRDRALEAGNDAARQWEAMTPADRWARSTPAEMLAMALHAERGQMVLDDLWALPASPIVIAEGSTVPAWVISAGIAEPSRAVWLCPSKEFQTRTLAANGTAEGPAQLYGLLREVIERETREHNAPTFTVDGSQSEQAMVEAVERRFTDAIATGPVAADRVERQHLLREINEHVVAQVRGYYARPWANGDPGAVQRRFVCECAVPTCDLALTLAVRDASAAAVLAPGHGAGASTER